MERVGETEQMLVEATLPASETNSPVKELVVMYDKILLKIKFEEDEPITRDALEDKCEAAVSDYFEQMRQQRTSYLEEIQEFENFDEFERWQEGKSIKLDREQFTDLRRQMRTTEGKNRVQASFFDAINVEETNMLDEKNYGLEDGNTKNKLVIVAKHDENENEESFMLPSEGFLPNLSEFSLSIAPVSIVHYQYSMVEDRLNSGQLHSDNGVYSSVRTQIDSSFPQQDVSNQWDWYKSVMAALSGVCVHKCENTKSVFSANGRILEWLQV